MSYIDAGIWMTNRLRIVLILISVIALGLVAFLFGGAETNSGNTADEFRLPIQKPVLEHDRPDLIGEPGMDEQQDPN